MEDRGGDVPLDLRTLDVLDILDPLEPPLVAWIQADACWLKNSPEEGEAEGKANK
jgi:hypothetical protein